MHKSCNDCKSHDNNSNNNSNNNNNDNDNNNNDNNNDNNNNGNLFCANNQQNFLLQGHRHINAKQKWYKLQMTEISSL